MCYCEVGLIGGGVPGAPGPEKSQKRAKIGALGAQWWVICGYFWWPSHDDVWGMKAAGAWKNPRKFGKNWGMGDQCGDGNSAMDLTPWKQGYIPLHPAMRHGGEAGIFELG
ncbi:hypothetical protein FIBSPDRAFT_896862 [Athelia psychrophila]|uniref:Uncharacterized protein n=1 Tax=Athelia psychrophila TaxID=1759441 RepID=A0A166CYF5_9AGAM|nr:hypothetical protein FIBSPDRAFT_896862 [Fibularhizoctonia sp. CBS 109695]